MDATLVTFNAAMYAVLSLAAAAAVLASQVRDGVVVKLGLIFLSLGFGFKVVVLFDGLQLVDAVLLTRANALVNVGALIVALGYVLRSRAAHRKQRRSSDWVHLDTRPMDAEHLR